MLSIKYQILISSAVVGLLVLFIGILTWKTVRAQNESSNQNESLLLSNNRLLFSIQKEILDLHKWFCDPVKGVDPSESITEIDNHIHQLQSERDSVHISALLYINKRYQNYLAQYEMVTDDVSFQALSEITDDAKNTIRGALASNYSWYENKGKERNIANSKLGKWILLGASIVFLFSIICGQVIAHILEASLRGLKAAAKAYETGDYSKKINISARNEFGELSEIFNRLSTEAEQGQIIEHQNQELDDLNHQLKLKNDSLDSFVYRVSHDLKAPLINIKSLLKVVNGKLANHGDSAVIKTLGFMDKNTEKLQQTIYDLLEVSKIEMNLNQKKEWVKIQPIIDEINEENIDDITSSGTKIILDFSDTDTLLFSKTNLKSVLANLITNGIKYRKDEGQNEIYISTHVIGNSTQLIYEDNGIGINLEKHREKLFSIFNRFHNHVEGSGVGLYIVKKLVVESGGKIEIESHEGVGTKFIINFPEA